MWKDKLMCSLAGIDIETQSIPQFSSQLKWTDKFSIGITTIDVKNGN